MFYVNVPTLLVAEAVKEKLISLGYQDGCGNSRVGKICVFLDKSFTLKDYVVCYPYPIREEVSLDRLFSIPEPPKETEIPGVLAPPYTIFKKGNGDFSIRERGREGAFVPAVNVARIKDEVNKFLSSPSLPDSFFVRVPAPELSELVQKRLFSLGYGTVYKDNKIGNTERPFIEVDDNIFSRNSCRFTQQITNEIQIADLWKTRKSVVLPGLVPGYQVEICESGVKVGCQTISFDSINKL